MNNFQNWEATPQDMAEVYKYNRMSGSTQIKVDRSVQTKSNSTRIVVDYKCNHPKQWTA